MSYRPSFPPDFRLVLASQSPRRHSLLRDVGVPFIAVSSRAEEVKAGQDAPALCRTNALAKVWGAVLPDDLPVGAFVLGTDTVVSTEDNVLGKPASPAEATEMLAALSGRTHQVVSGVALLRTGGPGFMPGGGEVRVESAVTDVTFVPLEPSQIEAYVATGEWKGKAGGYAIQGLAGLFVSRVQGEYSNVVGLPLCLLARLFRELGFDLVRRQWL